MALNADSRPDLLRVVITHEDELAASHADLQVKVRGSSLVTGNAALTKAREVAALVQALAGVGVPEASIRVEDIAVQVESGSRNRTRTNLSVSRFRGLRSRWPAARGRSLQYC
jgi:hypothetical protein